MLAASQPLPVWSSNCSTEGQWSRSPFVGPLPCCRQLAPVNECNGDILLEIPIADLKTRSRKVPKPRRGLAKKLLLRIPTEGDWGDYRYDLDQKWAHDQFGGRSN